ncbi:MAG: haloalkane dehalogenase, partial [Deltaproteobacteria bacterium]|nr:haloalkane dehalogenase [Deltaproteobacteria bacterium]
RELDSAAQGYYESAFPSVGSRKAVRQWPREIPIDGKPADNHAVVEAYGKWLTATQLPKILFHGSPGTIIREEELAWCRENLANLQIVDIGDGLHFIQEDNPDQIGTELARWFAALDAEQGKVALGT